MYRRTVKYSEIRQQQMQAARRARATEQAAPHYPQPLPALRMRITIERFDFGAEAHVIELHRTPRVDQFRALVDGQPWRDRIGLARVLAGIRKSLPRVLSERNL